MTVLSLTSARKCYGEKVEPGRRRSALSYQRYPGSRHIFAPAEIGFSTLANVVRRRKNGDKAYFIVNRHINHTNVCENLCKLCAFGREADHPRAYTLSLDEVEAKALASRGERISEIHIVGGLNPDLKLDYYVEMLRRVRKALPGV